MIPFRTKSGHHPDYVYISCLWIIVFLGLIILSSASSDLGKMKFNDTYYYIKHQILYGLTIGIIGFITTSLVNYKLLRKITVPLLFLSILLLLLVYTPLGFNHAGANRWLNFGSFSFQPSELLKFTFIIYMAAWLSPKTGDYFGLRQKSFFSGFLPFMIISGAVAVLVLLQPSTTTVFIIMSAVMAMYFSSGAKLHYILGIIFLAFLLFAIFIYATPYRSERVKMFLDNYLNPSSVNIQGEGYHLTQSLMAIGTGGLTGVGFGKSTAKFNFLPEPIGDSIFAVVAGELGFIGAIILILLFFGLSLRGFKIANSSRDAFAKMTVIGFTVIIAIQVFIHIAAISGIFPLTGVPLPFVSYGGTSLAIFLTMAGTIVNISKYA